MWKLDRIGRSLNHMVGLVSDLQARGAGLQVLTGGTDATSAAGRLVFEIFATLAEFERDLIKERTLAGLAAAQARGRNGGRPRLIPISPAMPRATAAPLPMTTMHVGSNRLSRRCTGF